MIDTQLIETAKGLTGVIRENIAAGEARAQIVPEVVAAVGRAGLFRLYAPKEVGGLEANPQTCISVMEVIASADPAVAWYIANSAPACLIAASLPDGERDELFADRDTNFGFSASMLGRAIPVSGGYRVTGEWPVVTGSLDSKWCALGGLVMDDNRPRELGGIPDGRLFLIRTSDIEISKTWANASAMRGTASNAVRVGNVFVPEALSYSPSKPLVINRPLYRLPFSLVFASSPPALVCGILRSALESSIEAISTKTSSISGCALRDQPPTQELIAECSGALRAARAGLLEASSATWDCVTANGEVPKQVRAELYASAFHACDVGREMISRLYTRGTRAAFVQGNPVERALRNIHAMTFTLENIRNLHHDAGRVLMGGNPVELKF